MGNLGLYCEILDEISVLNLEVQRNMFAENEKLKGTDAYEALRVAAAE